MFQDPLMFKTTRLEKSRLATTRPESEGLKCLRSTPVWMIVCKDSFIFKPFHGSADSTRTDSDALNVVCLDLCVRRYVDVQIGTAGQAQTPRHCQHQTFIQQQRQRNRCAARIESYPARIEFHVMLAHERATQDLFLERRSRSIWKRQVSHNLEITRSFLVNSFAVNSPSTRLPR